MEMEYQKSKSMTILSGVVSALFGLVLILIPGLTIASFVLVFAGYLIIYGIVRVVESVLAPEGSSYRLPWLLLGVLAVLAGLGLIFYPTTSVVLLAYYAAFYAIAVGVMEMVVAFANPKSVGREILLIIAGVLSILFGIYLFIYPVTGLVFLVAFLGWYSLIFGVMLVIYGIANRSTPDDSNLTSQY